MRPVACYKSKYYIIVKQNINFDVVYTNNTIWVRVGASTKLKMWVGAFTRYISESEHILWVWSKSRKLVSLSNL